MDEPLNGLDPLAQRAFTNLMRQLSSKGIAIVISSHQVSDLEALADKIALLHHGQVLIDGTLEHIRGKLKLDSDSDIVEMICAVTGIQPDEISLDIARDSIMPLRKPGGKKNERSQSWIAYPERKNLSNSNDGNMAASCYFHSILKLGSFRYKGKSSC